ncbi:MAG: site-2 protease family protein [Clostridia bacterium]|nr:site-2 protease family protein [Clostridia bacterium]
MLLSMLTGGSIQDTVISLLLSLPIIILALTIHETAHGYAAWKCGDPTAYNLGRLSLNPIKHLDLIGTLCMLLVGFGWAKPVPINTRYFRNPKRDMAITAAAGPLSNLLLGAFFAVLFGILEAFYIEQNYLCFLQAEGSSELLCNIFYWAATLCMIGALVNFTFAFFNLIPIPPFDGSRIFFAFLPTKAYFAIMRYERQIMYGLLIALMACSIFFDFSPTAWLAEQLTDLISHPFRNIFLKQVLLPEFFA